MPQGDTSTSPPDPVLELTRWRTRFASQETETAYCAWQVDQAVPFNRVGAWGGVFVWSAVAVGCGALAIYLSWLPVMLLVVLTYCWETLTTYRRSLRRWMPPSVMAANTAGGVLLIGMMANADTYHLQPNMAGLIIASFYGFGVIRLRPVQAVVAVTPRPS